MRLEALERHTALDGPVSHIDARWTLLGTLAYVLVVVLTPLGQWRPLAIEGLLLAFAIGLTGVPPLELLRRWLGFFLLVAFLAATVAPGHPLRSSIGLLGVGLGLAAKNSLAFLAVITLTAVVPFPRLLGALRRLGAPAVLIATLHFMHRYLHVLTEELDRMVKARRSRNFTRTGRLDWGILTGLIGVLLLRAMERGERVHSAMLARGWDGTLRTLDGAEGR